MTVGTDTRSATADGTRRRARTVLALLALFIVVNAADKAVLGLTAGPIKDDLGLSATDFGAIASSFYLLFSLSAVSVGFLGDRIRPRPLLAVLALVWAAAQLPILLPATGFGALVATRVVLGAGEGPGFPLANYTAFTWFPEKRRALPSAVVVAGGAGGTVLAAPLVVLVTNTLGWRAAFGLLGAAGVVWTLVWLRVGGGGPYAAHLGPGPADDEPSAEDVPTVFADGARPTVPFRRIVTTGTWLGATFSTFAVMWTLSLGFAWLPLFLEDQVGFSDAEISGIVGLPALSMAVLVLTAGAVAHRLLRRGRPPGSRRDWSARCCRYSPACACCSRPGPVPPPPAAVAGPGVLRGQRTDPLTNAAIADICPAGRRSAALGLSYALAALSSLLAPYATGRIIDAAPTEAAGYGRAFDLAACLLIAGAVVSALLIRPDRDALTLLAAHPATSSASAASSVSAESGADAEPTAKE